MDPGPGKYGDLCMGVCRAANAEGAVVIIMNGVRGSGFSVIAPTTMDSLVLANILEDVAQQIRAVDMITTTGTPH